MSHTYEYPRAAVTVEFDRVAAHHAALAVPWGLAMTHQESDAAHAAGLFQFFRHVKRPQCHTSPTAVR